jgi:hypothetical protein
MPAQKTKITPKTSAYFLLYADYKAEAKAILRGQNSTLSAFLQQKINELVSTHSKAVSRKTEQLELKFTQLQMKRKRG